ncbi:hypothetical protein D4T97_009440 [Siminovitchia acidinfaciens]|uniref:Uncharacterized protein n=1 Tax=Siminovitchia acidinfaciens TaxID=2321395 RepID=A0A429Y2H8_9BACI|nr:hypothetical protein [Siminovitchia acidinfaciens]RST75453.1 hypothetical protein D4T97_009440 [Siminovitchia acidinfaciens]
MRECLLIGDKHKVSAGEGVLCLQKRLAYDLEPMALAAGQHGDEGRLRTRHPVASLALGRPVRRSWPQHNLINKLSTTIQNQGGSIADHE